MSAFVQRATTYEEVARSVSKITEFDSSTIHEIIESKIELKRLANLPDKLDRRFLQDVLTQNKKSMEAFSMVMDLLLTRPGLFSQQEFSDFQVRLMAAENSISLAKNQYNSLMTARKMEDLLYP